MNRQTSLSFNLQVGIISLLFFTLPILSLAQTIETSVKKGDTFNTILRAHHVSESSIDLINASLDKAPILSRLNPGDSIELHLSKENSLVAAYIKQGTSQYVLNKTAHHFSSNPLIHNDSVTIVNTAFESADTERKADNKNQLIAQRAAKAFFPDFKSGTVYAAFENNVLVSLKAVSATETFYAFLQKTRGFPAYTDANGKVISPAISRMPIEHFWISSRFNPKRLHPISKKVRPHNGVDLSGPINTPIWAAANGKITHISGDTTFGNMIVIQHSNGVETMYAHLNKYHDNLYVGKEVQAFETIGYVGSTGISTGYHLHFEVHINGTPYDPLTVELPGSQQITSLALPHYF